MKKIILMRQQILRLVILVMFAVCVSPMSYSQVKLTITDGVDRVQTKLNMEKSASALLSEINQAEQEKRSLRLFSLNMSEEARHQLNMLWENSRFLCEDAEIVERCLTTNHGYQVRNIPLSMKPVSGSQKEQDYQEAVIGFSKDGRITSFNLCISLNMYSKVMQNTVEISDVRRRLEILDYVEHFRTSYNQKDMSFLRQVFSDDALIITGKVIKVQPSEVFPSGNKITYRKQNKQQYLNNLAAAFKNTRYIHVNFDDIKIVAHPTKKNLYGVTVHQSWNASNYSDEGYVFMIWDFTNEYEPKIHVRTWQPDVIDKSKGLRIDPNDVFSLGDFTL